MEDISCYKCGSLNEYTIVEKSGHKMAYCKGCESFIKNIAHQPPTFYFGKYKGDLISECMDADYLCWCLKNNILKGRQRDVAEKRYLEIS